MGGVVVERGYTCDTWHACTELEREKSLRCLHLKDKMSLLRGIVRSVGVLNQGLVRPVSQKTSPLLSALITPSGTRQMSTIVLTKDLERAQKSQEVSLRENCILVDVHDRPTGHASKRDCHRVGDNGKLLLHRAFSVFLFNTKGEMLVQRRSSHKVSDVE